MSNGCESLVENIRKSFAKVFPGRQPDFISRAAGRVELIGGHTDYNDGFIIAAAIDKSCRVAACQRDDTKICLYSQLLEQRHEFEISADLQPSPDCQWSNYGRGLAALFSQEGLGLKGANLYIKSDVPLGAGLSSSAALLVSIAKAMIRISEPDFQIKPIRLAQICQKAENIFANSPYGIMDQAVSLMGTEDHAILLDCRDLNIKQLPFDSSNCCIMIFNSMVRHEISGGEYGRRRESCEQAVTVLSEKFPQVKALRDADEEMLTSIKDQLDSVTFKRAGHIIGENTRVLAAGRALVRNDITEFGRLMNQSHSSARDLYQISCEETNFLADNITACKGAFGARLCGGGFGGAVVALIQPDAADTMKQKIHSAYKDKFNLDCQIYQTKASQGSEIVELK